MTERTHRCRRSCAAQVAFCAACWRLVSRRVQRAIYASWDRLQTDDDDLGAWGDHAELLLDTEAALEDERPWDSVAA